MTSEASRLREVTRSGSTNPSVRSWISGGGAWRDDDVGRSKHAPGDAGAEVVEGEGGNEMQRTAASQRRGESASVDLSAAAGAAGRPGTGMDDDPWLTLKQGSRVVQAHEATLRREIRAGRLRCARVGGRKSIRLRRSWLDTWLEASTTPMECLSAGTSL